jgi:hypothetical protein
MGMSDWAKAAGFAILIAAVPASAAAASDDPAPLGTVINEAIHRDGPMLTPAEQGVIRAKCGYAPGEWDGSDFSINNGVFLCSNGKKVDDPEMRALLKVVQPRISARVSAAMTSPEVQAAIRATADEAARKALANLRNH